MTTIDTPRKPMPAQDDATDRAASIGERLRDQLVNRILTVPEASELLLTKGGALAAIRAYARENTRQARDTLTAALRRALVKKLNRNAGKLGDALVAALRPWAEEAAPENLAEWLTRGGWDKVDGDKVETRLVTAARAAADAAGLQGMTAFVWPRPDNLLVLLYDLPRAANPWTEGDAPWKEGEPRRPMRWDTEEARKTWVQRVGVDACNRIMTASAMRAGMIDADLETVEKALVQTPPIMTDLAAVLTPEWNTPAVWNTPPEPASILLGFDALRAGLDAHDWATLALLTDKAGGDWLAPLAAAWLYARAGREETRALALPLGLQRRNMITAPSTGAAFLRFPSVLKDAGAWCGALVAVDGDTIFAEEPDLAAAPVRVLKDAGGADVQLYKPRAWTVAAEHRLAGARQMVLPGITLETMDPRRNPDLGAFLAVTATGAAVLDRLPGLCAKLSPLLFGLCPLDGTPVKGTLVDLVKLLYPDWRNRRKMHPSNLPPSKKHPHESRKDPGDIARVGAALTASAGLRIVEALPTGALRFYPMLHFDYFDAPTGPEQDLEVCLRLNTALAELATPAYGKGNFFLLNLSRLMELDARNPDRIAVAMRLAYYWHLCRQRTVDGRRVFLPERLDYLAVDALLIETNTAGPVADVIAGADLRSQKGNRWGKVKLSEARARLVDETLPALVAGGLLGHFDARRPDRYAGRGAENWLVKVPPPGDYLEATRLTDRTRRTEPPKGRTRRK